MSNIVEWLKQIKEVHRGKALICPYCNSKQVSAQFFRFSDGVGYGDIICNNCGEKVHISRMKFPDDSKANITDL